MKVCVLQPGYSQDYADKQACYDGMTKLMDLCGPDLDLIVLPEYCDIPVYADTPERYHQEIADYNEDIASRARELARRCHAIVFANYAGKTEAGWRNTTHCFDREGNEVGQYYKAHPTPKEIRPTQQGGNGLDGTYSYLPGKPCIVEIEGLRFCFLTCYDFYMYEGFAALAKEKPDIIIGCSHQRTDTHNTLDFIGKFLCYNTNAWLIRSSVSLGEDSPTGGCSMVVSPAGEMVLNMENRTGLGICDIDPGKKLYKPAGFHGSVKSHPEYIEDGRRPWLYRNSGSMMVPFEDSLPYPRVCAHRGFNTIAPENSMPAFGAAVALGADEIEFDIWSTKDGKLISLHDKTLDRVSDGHGDVREMPFEEIRKLDFGVKSGGHYKGLGVVLFEDILKKFSGTVIMNIHVKIWDYGELDPRYEEIAELLRRYDCERHCYMMSSSDKALREFHTVAPEIARCVGFDGDKENLMKMPERALKLGCNKVQLFKPYFTQETVDFAKANSIRTNVFYADDPEEAIRFRDMGIDTILTNDFLTVSNALRDHANGIR